MKKLVSVIALIALATPAFAATKPARPSYLTRNGNSAYNVTYSYTDKAKSGWYGSLRAELALLNWKNKYSSAAPESLADDHDDYSFEPLFAFNGAFGKRLNYFWRVEVEGGYITKFTDEDAGYKFTLDVPYLIANGYYDFVNGLYVGAGLGVAFPTTTLDSAYYTDNGNRSKTAVSPMAGLMLGYSHKLDDNLVLDLRYRLAGFYGTKQSRALPAPQNYLENKIGLILDNSISIGIRYEF